MIITLTTDFGLSDPFVGVMKGVMLGIAANAQLVDVTHDIPSYDTIEATFIVESSYRYFPAGTVHLIVVDPGVGSDRRPLAGSVNGHIFVAPDNGVLSFVLQAVSGAQPRVYHIKNENLFRKPVSRTFHGRDIFAPVAAYLARGAAIESVGPQITDFITLPFPTPRFEGNRLLGTVLRIDKFGNVMTNLRLTDLGPRFRIRVAGDQITRLRRSYSEARPGEVFAIEGSAGFIELAMNKSSAVERLRVERGVEIELETESVNL
jgi:S-adenosylmethionine hydrolase